MLDDGRITDSQGRTVDFKNTILIMTSNIGSGYLLDGIDAGGNISQAARDATMKDLKAHFRPEFLNRLDEIILFKPLTKDNVSDIVDILMQRLNHRLAEKELKVVLTDKAKNYIVDHGYDPLYGARPLKRYLQKNVETMIAKMILSNELSPEDTIFVDAGENGLTAYPEKVED